MALDEGRMGKKESDRAEGQYKMKKRDDDVATGSSGPAGAPSIDQPRSAPVADPYMEPPPPPPPPPRHEIQQPPPVDDVRTDKEGRPVPYAGRMAKVMDLLAAHKLDAALAALAALEQRLARAERVQRETVESLERLRKAVRGVDSEMARRADVKKLKNVLDQLEVVEIAEGPPQPAVDG